MANSTKNDAQAEALNDACNRVARIVSENEGVLRALQHIRVGIDNGDGEASAEELREMASDLLSALRNWTDATNAFLASVAR